MKCMNCNNKSTHEVKIGMMGWGSQFDNVSTQVNLCESCYSEHKEWWDLEIIQGKDEWDGCKYKYEDEIFEYIDNMPVESQELFWNTYASDGHMKAQDWIDHTLGVLSHDKAKEYGLYSNQEMRAYDDRFPTCSEVIIKVHNDGSKGSFCYMGARGNEEGKCGLNISHECYMCKSYKERPESIEIMSINERKEFPELQHSYAVFLQ